MFDVAMYGNRHIHIITWKLCQNTIPMTIARIFEEEEVLMFVGLRETTELANADIVALIEYMCYFSTPLL